MEAELLGQSGGVREAEATSPNPCLSFAHGACVQWGEGHGAQLARGQLCVCLCASGMGGGVPVSWAEVPAGKAWAVSSEFRELLGVSTLSGHLFFLPDPAPPVSRGLQLLLAEGLKPPLPCGCALQWRGKEADRHLVKCPT